MALTGSGKDHVYIWPSLGQVKTIYGPHWVRQRPCTYIALTGSGKDHVSICVEMASLRQVKTMYIYIWPSLGQAKTMYIYGPYWVR